MNAKKNYKLLLVDDDQLMRMVYQNFFARFFDISLASNGKEALMLLTQQDFDAILTDINMPEMSGIELTQATKKLSSKNAQVMIIGITAYDDRLRSEALTAGMKKIFKKPVELLRVKAYLQAMLA